MTRKDPHIYPKLFIRIASTRFFSPYGFYFSYFCLWAHTNEERIFSLWYKSQLTCLTWTALPHSTATARSLQESLRLQTYSSLSLFLPVPLSVLVQELCLTAAALLPPYGYCRSFVTRCLQHPWRYIAAASICPLSSPENNEANNFFNYLSRAASSVNKFILLSPEGLAFYFIKFFRIHLKHVLLFILISTARFLSFSTFAFIINFMLFFSSIL